MKFGVCAPIEEAHAILDAGFDYVEVGAAGFNGVSENWNPSPYQGLPIFATNLFFDSRIKLFEPGATPYREYAERTIRRTAELGIAKMVIGSGPGRKAPEGFDGEGAFIEVAADVASIARPIGITIAPESLNRSETNVGNNLRSLALGLQERGVAYTADSYHVLFEWDADGRLVDIDTVWVDQVPFSPAHVHIADLPRLAASPNDPMLHGFIRRLRDLGYDETVSLECRREAQVDLPQALSDLKSLFEI